MNAYDKKRAKNIAERDAIFSKIFEEFITDNKPVKRSRVSKKLETSSKHEESNDNNDDGEYEISETPPKKRKYYKSKTVEKREYNLRARIIPAVISSESDEYDKDSTSKRKRNHHNTYKTRSWYHENKTDTENDRMRTKDYEEKNESMEEEIIGSEKIESDLQHCVPPVETMDKCIVDDTNANLNEISMEKS